jgi:sulfatase maturation enzyme AslB (radical SAM superfamily)
MSTETCNTLPFSFRNLPVVPHDDGVLLYSPFKRELVALTREQQEDGEVARWFGHNGYVPKEIEIWDASLQMNDVVLCVTTKCNLNCPYCSAASDISPPDMTVAMARAALDAALRERDSRPVRVHFSGGEPTLNFECIARSVEQLERSGAPYEPIITVNGNFPEETVRYLARRGFKVLVSLDSANPAIQNVMRPTRSFVSAVRTLQDAALGSRRVGVRTTVSKLNVQGLCEIVELCSKLGGLERRIRRRCCKQGSQWGGTAGSAEGSQRR